MSIFKLKNPDCVLFHIPKTGGTSIRKGVWNKIYDGPVFAAVPEDWGALYKFAFVRHPFDRFISVWKCSAKARQVIPIGPYHQITVN